MGIAADGLWDSRHIACVGIAADGLRCIGRGFLLAAVSFYLGFDRYMLFDYAARHNLPWAAEREASRPRLRALARARWQPPERSANCGARGARAPGDTPEGSRAPFRRSFCHLAIIRALASRRDAAALAWAWSAAAHVAASGHGARR